MGYKVWAQQVMADGRLRASAVHESAQVGDPVDLQEALGGLAGARLVLTGVEAWKELAPFQLEWKCVTPGMREVVEVPESLEVVLPPSAVDRVHLGVLGKDRRHDFSYEHEPQLAVGPPRVEIALLVVDRPWLARARRCAHPHLVARRADRLADRCLLAEHEAYGSVPFLPADGVCHRYCQGL